MRRRRPPSRRSSHTLLRWETLGHSVTGLEALEARQLLAADLAISLGDDLVAGITRQYYTPGSQVVYTLKVTNSGDATATNARLTTTLAPAITQATWTAAYSGVGTQGDLSYDDSGTPRTVANVRAGMGDLAMALTVAAGGSATFTIIATVGGAGATGNLVSSAQVAFDGTTQTATDTDRFVPKSAVVTADAGWASDSLVRLVDPATGTTLASAYAFEPGLKAGVRAAMGDLDGDGKAEIVCTPGYGRLGEIAVLRQDVDGAGHVTLVKEPALSGIVPFAGYQKGLDVVTGDFNGDGADDVAVAQTGGAGLIRLYRSVPGALQLVTDKTFSVPEAAGPLGVSLATGDFGTFVDGVAVSDAGPDGLAELVVASRGGVPSVVAIVDVSAAAPALIDTIHPFAAGFLGGLSVTVARIGRDSILDLIVAQGRGGSSQVKVFDGQQGANGQVIASFAAFADLARANAPVFTAAIDTDGDGRADRIDAVQGGTGRGPLRSFSVNTAPTTGAVSITRASSLAEVSGRLRVAAAALRNATALVTTDSGLQYIDLEPGSGSAVGSSVTVDYTGTYTPTAGSLTSKVFDTSKVTKGTNPPAALQFWVGSGAAIAPAVTPIQGFGEGLKSMKVGGIRQLIVPNYLGYKFNPNGTLNTTSPFKDSTLTFEVQVKSSS